MSWLSVVLMLAILLLVPGSLEASQGDSSLEFLVLGDWGGQPDYPYTTPAEVELAKVMGSKATEINSQFTLALGDNFYSTGVTHVNDKRFNETFEVSTVYRGLALFTVLRGNKWRFWRIIWKLFPQNLWCYHGESKQCKHSIRMAE